MKGIYVLVIQLDKNIDITVGSLGKVSFKKGFYAYIGSAQTSLETRIERHLKRKKRLFWHIDYLLDQPEAKIARTFIAHADRNCECTTAKDISKRGETILGFGCSDCNCKSHLVRLDEFEFLHESMHEFGTDKRKKH